VTLAEVEARTIREFVLHAAGDGFLAGRVLDFGCGLQPYREIVEANGGQYTGYDRKSFRGSVVREDVGGNAEVGAGPWASILCTQVLQYVTHPDVMIRGFYTDLHPANGYLVLTYPTHWPELRDELWRFTKLGVDKMLTDAGFKVVRHEPRAVVHDPWYETRPGARTTLMAELTIGYGVIARA
jgi:hypothetical protein